MNTVKSVAYARETDLDPAEFRCVLLESGLARPTDDLPRLGEMLRGADLVVTARFDQADRKLIGIARCITDFSWCCYLSELAVSKEAQGLGIGKGLIERDTPPAWAAGQPDPGLHARCCRLLRSHRHATDA